MATKPSSSCSRYEGLAGAASRAALTADWAVRAASSRWRRASASFSSAAVIPAVPGSENTAGCVGLSSSGASRYALTSDMWTARASSEVFFAFLYSSIASCAWPCAHSTVSANRPSAPAAFSKASAALNHFGGSLATVSRKAVAEAPLKPSVSRPLMPLPTLSNEVRKSFRCATVDLSWSTLPWTSFFGSSVCPSSGSATSAPR